MNEIFKALAPIVNLEKILRKIEEKKCQKLEEKITENFRV